jgi:UDP-N-acetylmuramyl pentapeptide synthase
MLELGTETENEHLNISRLLENLGIYGYTVGEEFMKVQSENFIGQFMNLEEATKFFRQQSFSESLIILKGSRGIGLENLETLF